MPESQYVSVRMDRETWELLTQERNRLLYHYSRVKGDKPPWLRGAISLSDCVYHLIMSKENHRMRAGHSCRKRRAKRRSNGE